MISSAYITLKWLVEIIGFKGDGVPQKSEGADDVVCTKHRVGQPYLCRMKPKFFHHHPSNPFRTVSIPLY